LIKKQRKKSSRNFKKASFNSSFLGLCCLSDLKNSDRFFYFIIKGCKYFEIFLKFKEI